MKRFSLIGFVCMQSLREGLKNRFTGIFLIFAVAMIYASLLAGVMAVDEESRVILDFGLGIIELMSLAYVVFTAATAVSREIETKTIYLVFSRPVSRPVYLFGKLAGIYALTAAVLSIMGVLHSALMLFRGPFPWGPYWLSLALIWCKLAIIGSVAFFVASFSSSPVSTLLISGILWTLGHFAPETRFLSQKAGGVAGYALKAMSWFVPNMQYYNLRDVFSGPYSFGTAGLLHLFMWIAFSYGMTVFLFRKKEF